MKGLMKGGLGMAACMLLIGCSEQATEQAGDPDKVYVERFVAEGVRKTPEDLMVVQVPSLTAAHLSFAFTEFLTHHSSVENALSAPFDVQQQLSMTALGADGTTLDDFSNATGFDLADSATYAGMSIWEQRVDSLSGVERQRFLWGQQRYLFSNDYLQAQAALVGPVVGSLDFQNQADPARNVIEVVLNGDFSLTEISNITRLVHAQTTRVESAWPAFGAVEVITGRFGQLNAQHWVSMVRVEGLLNVVEGDNYRAVEVPLAEPGLSLIMIIPAPESFDTIRNGLNTAFWTELRAGLVPAETAVLVPALSWERDVASGYMPNLGTALNSNAANFSKVNNSGFLFLKSPRQHITLTVNEQGLSATTTTAVVHAATESEPHGQDWSGSFGVEIFAPGNNKPCFFPPDQYPYLFAIYAAETDTVLYLGQVMALDGPTVEPDWVVPYIAQCGDSPLVDVYKYSGALQCQLDSGISPAEMAQTLTDAGVEVVRFYESTDGLARAAVCDAPDGTINVFSIHESQLRQALDLGFERLSDLLTP